ncbi:8656_t:CDS:2, partial [Racocetra persica]
GFTFNSNFQVKVVIKIKKSDPIPAKWFTFELDNFDIFQDNLIKHIQDHINNNHIDKNNIQKNKLTTIKTSPSYLTFGIINAIKANIQVLQLQSPSVIKLNSGLIPSLQEFFEELDKNHNGNSAYLDLKAGFEQEEITINTIKNLSDTKLIQLGFGSLEFVIEFYRKVVF